jgi:hypothetical protein
VNDEKDRPNTTERQDIRLGHEVDQTTWSSNENVTALGQLLSLFTHRTTAIGNARAEHRAIAKTTRLVEDLTTQLTSWCYDEDQRLSTNSVDIRVEAVSEVWATSSKLLNLAHELRDGRDQVSSGLPRACAKVRDIAGWGGGGNLPVWAIAMTSRDCRTAGMV